MCINDTYHDTEDVYQTHLYRDDTRYTLRWLRSDSLPMSYRWPAWSGSRCCWCRRSILWLGEGRRWHWVSCGKFVEVGRRVWSMQEPWTKADEELRELLLSVFRWAPLIESQRQSDHTRAGLATVAARGRSWPDERISRSKATDEQGIGYRSPKRLLDAHGLKELS